jgi:hypothetical protein
MKFALTLVAVLLAQIATYPPDYGDMSKRGKKGKAGVGKTPKKLLAEDAIAYWGMEACGNDTRTDSIGDYDLVYSSGTCVCEAGYFGNQTAGSGTCGLTTTSWPNSGDDVVGQTMIWWLESTVGGTPGIAGIFQENTSQKQVMWAYDESGSRLSASIKQYPLDSWVNTPTPPTCDYIPAGGHCFFALRIDGEDVDLFMGNSDGDALQSVSTSLTAGNTARWGDSFLSSTGVRGWDDWMVFDWALSDAELKKVYNKGAGAPLL